jgi:glucose-6-phosphate isomerase
MISTHFTYQDALIGINTKDIAANLERLDTAYKQLNDKSGKGNDFLGWINLPESFSEELLQKIEKTASDIAKQSEIVVVIGIGGSYLGARAVIEALQLPFPEYASGNPEIVYAGNSLSEDYLYGLTKLLDKKKYSLIVISKSGTTTEPAIAFRILKEHCEKKYGQEESVKRIFAITDKSRGALKTLATKKGYVTFDIPDDVGGRYSVLTPVGLLPIAIAGFDIDKLLSGASEMKKHILSEHDFEGNISMQYSLIRYLLYRNMKKIELMVAYEPRLFFFTEWFKQLFGESEGKENAGIFPCGAIFSTDLHSLGQYIQEGERDLFETVISVEKAQKSIAIPCDQENIDKLNYLVVKSIHEINQIAERGTRMAHIAGGVPNFRIIIPEISEITMGELIYFFEFSCALSGYMLGVNPFDQPGVEAYKQNMFSLLGKPV